MRISASTVAALKLCVRQIVSLAQADRRMLFAAIACCFCLSSCKSASNEKYTPTETSSRNALVQALDQWKAGEKAALIKGKPSVQIVDTGRQQGQRLVAYDIISDESLDVGRRYQVKVKLDNPNAEQTLQYVVVGIDPLLVFRQEDYDMLAHWEMEMPASPESSQPEKSNAQ